MSKVYDYTGQVIPQSALEDFLDNIDVDYAFDSATNANYTVIRVYQKKIDGTKQFPFAYAPNGSSAGTKSTMDMATDDGWVLAINGGVFNSTTKVPDGIIIQNGVSVQNSPASVPAHIGAMPLTIDENGDLSYASADANTTTLIANGIKSAVCGFFPIIVDFDAVDASFYNWVSNYNLDRPRQIIGQFGNGDYAIVTCEGNNSDNSDGWTIAEAITVCQKLGLKVAYNLDGGGSAETMLGLKHINTIYENTTGRVVPTFIVFNGKDEFFIPNA